MSSESTRPQTFPFPLTGGVITIGRDPSCDIIVDGMGVSRTHVKIDLTGPVPVLNDHDSSFGTFVNNSQVRMHTISDGDVLAVGIAVFDISLNDSTLILARRYSTDPEDRTFVRQIKDRQITIGRDGSNDIQINHPLVSRFHARMSMNDEGQYSITDLRSNNGTFVNGNPAQNIVLSKDDIIQIGPYRFFFIDGRLMQTDDFNRVKLEVVNITVRTQKSVLLNNVSFEIYPGEFVAVLGPSGAGKTTLAQALTGRIPLQDGNIFYNGLPLKRFFKAFRTSVGYVAQENLLHRELTVLETFREQGILRLPRDSAEIERLDRINEVMDLLELRSAANRRISKLSGGEAKRVHLGIELLSSPTLIFLDEPLAGLDPALIKRFMLLFKKISDKGHTLIITTHLLEQIDQCDRIIFMNKGTLEFNGSPGAIIDELGVDSIAQAYEVTKKSTAPMESRPVKRLTRTSEGVDQQMLRKDQKEVRFYHPKSASFLKQLGMLVIRYAKVLARDVRNLGLLFLQPALIAVLLAFVFSRDMNFLPLSFYFCLTISALWFGGMNSVREIAGEWLCFDREYSVGLSIGAYILSKIVVLGLFAVIQALVFSGCLFLIFENINQTLSTVLLIITASCGGVLFGLCISAFSGNVRQAISWLPIILIPQIFYSGILIPFDRMTAPGRFLSLLTVSKPVFTLFKRQAMLEQSIWLWTEWRSLFCLFAGLIILMVVSIRWRRII
ncbi:MAG: FHA domain-containing protein [Chitinivibrionales bacterium]|nr:FHA domain-containing protein [Chitinivibrionales bacterium]